MISSLFAGATNICEDEIFLLCLVLGLNGNRSRIESYRIVSKLGVATSKWPSVHSPRDTKREMGRGKAR